MGQTILTAGYLVLVAAVRACKRPGGRTLLPDVLVACNFHNWLEGGGSSDGWEGPWESLRVLAKQARDPSTSAALLELLGALLQVRQLPSHELCVTSNLTPSQARTVPHSLLTSITMSGAPGRLQSAQRQLPAGNS